MCVSVCLHVQQENETLPSPCAAGRSSSDLVLSNQSVYVCVCDDPPPLYMHLPAALLGVSGEYKAHLWCLRSLRLAHCFWLLFGWSCVRVCVCEEGKRKKELLVLLLFFFFIPVCVCIYVVRGWLEVRTLRGGR